MNYETGAGWIFTLGGRILINISYLICARIWSGIYYTGGQIDNACPRTYPFPVSTCRCSTQRKWQSFANSWARCWNYGKRIDEYGYGIAFDTRSSGSDQFVAEGASRICYDGRTWLVGIRNNWSTIKVVPLVTCIGLWGWTQVLNGSSNTGWNIWTCIGGRKLKNFKESLCIAWSADIASTEGNGISSGI